MLLATELSLQPQETTSNESCDYSSVGLYKEYHHPAGQIHSQQKENNFVYSISLVI